MRLRGNALGRIWRGFSPSSDCSWWCPGPGYGSRPPPSRAVGLGLFVLLALAASLPLVWFRWPSVEQGLTRLDRGSGIAHRPATTLTDTLSTQDPVALALWQGQRGAPPGP